MTSLSVLVPVFNEERLVSASLGRLETLAQSPHLSRIEVIVVDDGSTDGTGEALARVRRELTQSKDQEKMSWVFLRHERNLGKGAAIQTALARATCELSVVQDADLEYHPRDLLRIVEVFVEEQADAVFGSRFANAGARRVLLYHHELGNRFLTFLCNVVTNLNLTDMETGYKAVRTSLLKSIPIASNDFRIEPELTIKLAKRGARLFEVPIAYSGRAYAEGKKINWKDGLKALGAIARFAVSNQVYQAHDHGADILGRLRLAPRFNAWMADAMRTHCGERVLEIGSGLGNLTEQLIPRSVYIASDVNPLYLEALAGLSENRPYLSAVHCDLRDGSTFPKVAGGFDTVICANVIEHMDDDRGALRNIREALCSGGRAIVLVPCGPWNYGSLDEVLEHRRRYTRESLAQLAEDCGFVVKETIEFNRIGTVAWFLNGRILRRRTFGLGQVRLLNTLTPLFRLLDRGLPLPPLSLIGVLERRDRQSQPAGATDDPRRDAPSAS